MRRRDFIGIIYAIAAGPAYAQSPDDRGDHIVDLQSASGKAELLLRLATELTRRPVDVLVAVSAPAALAAKKATSKIPIVFTRVSDPVSVGLVTNLTGPEGNVTGLSFRPDALSSDRLALLKELLPKVTRVAALWYPGDAGNAVIAQALEPLLPHLSIELLHLRVHSAEDFESAFDKAVRAGAEAVLVIDDDFLAQYRHEVLDLARRHALPIASMYRAFSEAGALMSYGPNKRIMYRRVAHLIDKILSGVAVEELAVEQPAKSELIINRTTAEALGIMVPAALLVRADEVIQ